jgi:hypothetical protein
MDELKVKPDPQNSITGKDLKRLLDMASSISYGSITLLIQDGKAIQIEKHEKMRLR